MDRIRATTAAAAVGVALLLAAGAAEPAVSRELWAQFNAIYAFNLRPDPACQDYARRADAILRDPGVNGEAMQARLRALWAEAKPCLASPRVALRQSPRASVPAKVPVPVPVKVPVPAPAPAPPIASTARPVWPSAGNDLAPVDPGLTAAELAKLSARAAPAAAALPKRPPEPLRARAPDTQVRAAAPRGIGPAVVPLEGLPDLRHGVRDAFDRSLADMKRNAVRVPPPAPTAPL